MFTLQTDGRTDGRTAYSGNTAFRMATHVENLEKSGNLRVVREKSGKIGKVGGKSGKMCSCMHEIWPIGSQKNH